MNKFFMKFPETHDAYKNSTGSLVSSESFQANTLPNGRKFYKKSQKNESFSESSTNINRSPAKHLVYNLGRRVHNTTANVVRKCSFTSSLITNHNGSKRSSSLLSKGPTMSTGSLTLSDDLNPGNSSHNSSFANGDDNDDEKTILHNEFDEDGIFERNGKSDLFTGSLRVSPSKMNGLFSDGSTEVCSLGRAEVRVCRSNRKSRVIPIIDDGYEISDVQSTADKIVQELADANSVIANELNLEIKNAPLASQEVDNDRSSLTSTPSDNNASNGKQKPPKTKGVEKQEKSRFKSNRTTRVSSICVNNKENKFSTSQHNNTNGKSLREKYSPLSWTMKGSDKNRNSMTNGEVESRIVVNCDYCLSKNSKHSLEELPINSCFSCEEEMIFDLISSPPSPSNPPVWSVHRPPGNSVHLHPHLLKFENDLELIHRVSPYTPLCDVDILPTAEDQLTETNILNNPEIFPPPVNNGSHSIPNGDYHQDSDEEMYHQQHDNAYYKRSLANNLIENKRILLNSWVNPKEFLQYIANNGIDGLTREYNSICRIITKDNLFNFTNPMNRPKNRYNDVVCYDHNRVLIRCKRDPLLMKDEIDNNNSSNPQLSPIDISSSEITSNPSQNPGKVNSKDSLKSFSQSSSDDCIFNNTQNYIHANWVDSYRQKNAFICTQGPLKDTVGDFWRLIWDYNVPVIVMITKTIESSRLKCHQYWPKSGSATFPDKDISQNNSYMNNPFSNRLDNSDEEIDDVLGLSNQKDGNFKITKVHCVNTENYSKSLLRIRFSSTGEERNVHHYAFNAWPDHGVPKDTSYLLELLSSVNLTYQEHLHRHLGYTSIYDQDIPPPPIVVHCSAGIGRTGTFISLDVCTKALYDGLERQKKDPSLEVRLNIPLTVARIRSQRAGCVQVVLQYLFCYRALLSYMYQLNLITVEELDLANSYLTDNDESSMPWNYPYANVPIKDLNKFKNKILLMSSGKALLSDPNESNFGHNSSMSQFMSNNNNNNNSLNSDKQVVFPKPIEKNIPITFQKISNTDENVVKALSNDEELSDYENDYRKDTPSNGKLIFSSSSNNSDSTQATDQVSLRKNVNNNHHKKSMTNLSTTNNHINADSLHQHNPLSLSEYETEDDNFSDETKGTFESIPS